MGKVFKLRLATPPFLALVLGHRISKKHALLDGPWTSISAAWHQLIMRALAWAGSHLALSAQSRNRFGVCGVASHGQLAIGELLAGLFDVEAVRSVQCAETSIQVCFCVERANENVWLLPL